MILDTLKIPYEILEANDRIGGRIYTHRFNGDAGRDAPVNDPARYDYIDMGAMRYPNNFFMKRVFKLFERLDMDDILIEYKYSAPNTFRLYNGVRHNSADQSDLDIFNVSEAKGGAVPDEYVVKGVDDVSSDIFKPFAEAFQTLPFNEAWKKLAAYDPYSTRGYLLSKGYPDTVVEWLETFTTATGLYDDAFVESTMDAMDFANAKAAYSWYCIDGGSDNLTTRMAQRLTSQPLIGRRVTKIASVPGGGAMDVTFGKHFIFISTKRYAQVISTVPLGCLAAIDIPQNDLSYMKRMAIRCLNYDTSTKVALKFQSRWWEDPKIMGDRTIKGGVSSTDSPIRTCVYPSYGFHATGKVSGVILASYTWAQDAQRMGGLAQAKGSDADKLLIELTLKNLSELHNVPVEKFGPLLDHYVHNWHNDEHARGAFALFGPGQFGQPSSGNSLFASMKAPGANGKLHIAGEATSVHHAWVLGALNSAWRAVYNALGLLPDAQTKRTLLEETWGIPDEEDCKALLKLAVLGNHKVL
ncbi:hypothetical protein CONPUDRAFT_113488 [Coniophora puteana RWD-64-598 SS2]|uniref:Amine oxidase domain-containing protein n=1 Tax=Coniophora puteana (strain RWD-64-598) TaxID=741705 RepID=R7SE71_CONPW|nr:uncharacterized protein CONPUDRAFT_113488 [Coniophora puteana RWD-64-598 SS2]EIW74476.1 hypothetical protein CONPUDRAFT_113488 [Coniophora puteana RWD-64-598 SS2]